MSWRTVPTFAAGVLAALFAALLVWCRGAVRADSAVTDRMVRSWAAVWLRRRVMAVPGGLYSAGFRGPAAAGSAL